MNLLDTPELVFTKNSMYEPAGRAPTVPPTLAEALAKRGLTQATAPKEAPLDVAEELELAFRSAKRLLIAAEHDENIPTNQKAQLIGALNTVLASITKSRSEIYSAERNRRMEAALIATLKKHPELQASFMADYKEALNG